MSVALVHAPGGGLLRAVRETLSEGDEALLCVAFASEAGVHLIRKELGAAHHRTPPRLLVTTQFGSTTPAALELATRSRCEVRVHNPGRSTYHPKVFLSRRRDRASGVVGSANLTGGLVNNVEAAVQVRGAKDTPLLADTWEWAEALWDHDRTRPWERQYETAAGEQLEPDLLAHIRAALATDTLVRTLSRGQPNHVSDVTADAVYVETEKSRREGTGPQPVPAWMLNLAWSVLRTQGTLTNTHLLKDLRVHRSSFVLALLARLPGVEPLDGRAMGVRLRDPT